jgi:Protein of unknown function (DUF3365)
MNSLPWLRTICIFSGMSCLLATPRATGVQPAPTKEDSTISIYDDESALPVFQHHCTTALFLGKEGFGAERSGFAMFSHATMDPHVMDWSDAEGSYDAQIIDLIGILKGPKPRVYATMQDLYARDEMPEEDPDPTTPEKRAAEMSELQVPNIFLKTISRHDEQESEWKVRELDGFETKALGLLQAGHTMVWKDQGTSFRAVGAIRMQESCVSCHEDKKNGDLLGAFTYFGFKRPPAPEEDREPARKLAELARQEPYSKEFIEARKKLKGDYDRGNRQEWPIPPEQVFYIDREVAHMGIVTPGMIDRLKTLLASLPADKCKDDNGDAEPSPAN